jgi:TolB-like protein
VRALPIAIALFVSSSAFAEKGGKVSLAVTDLKARGVDETAAAALSTEVTNTLSELRVFSVISGEDIKRLLSLEATRQACTGEADAACLAEIGGALGVDYLVYGEVAKLGDTYSLSLALLDTAKASAVGRANEKVSDAGKLLAETGRLARALVQPLLESKKGFLVLEVRESGAKVQLAGRTVGVAPIGRLSVAMGPHEVVVEKDGFLPWARSVEVLPDQVTVETVTLVPNQEFIESYESSATVVRTAAWITAGTAAALLATAGVLRLIDDSRFDELVAKGYLEPRGVCADTNPSYNGTDLCPTDLGREKGVFDTVDGIERADTIALIAAIVGVASGAASAVLFLSGDPPGRYADFAAGAAGPKSGIELMPLGIRGVF